MNRQVPKRYCLIGDGKVARHMAHYFDLLGISHSRWFRSNKRTPLQKIKQLFSTENTSLKQALAGCDHVLLLISDDQIEPFIEQTPELAGFDLIHFSGALQTSLAKACHPLTTFNHGQYELANYQNIPFVHATDFDFNNTFPQLINPHHGMDPAQAARYHAYCVMAGNFSQMMWRALGREMVALGLPEQVLHPFISQNSQNFIAAPDAAATGPFVRGDLKTIAKHLDALQDSEFAPIYQAYLDWQQSTSSHNAQRNDNPKVAS